MRLRKRPWVKEEIMGYSSYIAPTDSLKGHWQRLFNNSNPIHLEIGTGKGKFITTLAKENPNTNYIALEQKQEVLVQAIRKANFLGLKNIKFILGNANYLANFFDSKEIARIYLNFVDPWEKKRHAKRRLTHKRFLQVYKTFLTDDGEIHLKTDNGILFESSLNELNENGFRLKNISLNLYRNQEDINNHIQTEYEEKFIEQGKPIYRLEAAFS